MHKEYADDSDRESVSGGKKRVLLKDTNQDIAEKYGSSSLNSMPPLNRDKIDGKLEGVYQNVSRRYRVFAETCANLVAVPPHSARSFFENPLHIAIVTSSGHPSVSIPESHRR